MSSKKRYLPGGGLKSRRQDRAKKVDATRLWREGQLDENSAHLERWSREAKSQGPKVRKDLPAQRFVADLGEGLVLEVHRRTVKVLTADNRELECRYAPHLDKQELGKCAVGDHVHLAVESDLDAMVTEILPRTSIIVRPGPEERKHRGQVLAANVDLILVVMAQEQPDFNGRLLDRYLAVSERIELPVLVLVNKSELVGEPPREMEYLERIGYECLRVSAQTGMGMELLRRRLMNTRAVLSGPSGVGKTSLVKALAPHLHVTVGEVRERDGKGRHTTTHSRFYFLENGIQIIDTPGLRELGLWEVESHELKHLFREFRPLTSECRFRDCLHVHEPGCRVREEVENGNIPDFRYDSYLRLLDSIDAS